MDNSTIPLVSIIVPVFNGAKYIRATIESLVLVNEKVGIEVIFQDALSTDGTSEIIEEYLSGHKNFLHFKEKDLGQSDAINRGMKRANGKWVTWLCADDLMLSDFATMLSLAERGNGADVVYGDCVFLQNGNIFPAIGTERYENGKLSKKRLFIQQPGTCILREKWLANAGVDDKLNWTMDYDLFLRLENDGCKFRRFKGFVSVARIHDEAKTSSGSFSRLREHFMVIGRIHFKRFGYFSLVPYVTYFVEYIIKRIEAKNKESRLCLKWLHSLFWKISYPAEKNLIQQRFENNMEKIQKNIFLFEGFNEKKDGQ